VQLRLNALGRGGTETNKERRLGEKPQTNQADRDEPAQGGRPYQNFKTGALVGPSLLQTKHRSRLLISPNRVGRVIQIWPYGKPPKFLAEKLAGLQSGCCRERDIRIDRKEKIDSDFAGLFGSITQGFLVLAPN
jgi:hypothetical protein